MEDPDNSQARTNTEDNSLPQANTELTRLPRVITKEDKTTTEVLRASSPDSPPRASPMADTEELPRPSNLTRPHSHNTASHLLLMGNNNSLRRNMAGNLQRHTARDHPRRSTANNSCRANILLNRDSTPLSSSPTARLGSNGSNLPDRGCRTARPAKPLP